MTFEYHKIMPVSFVIPEEQILAVCGIDFLPVFEGQFYGRKRRMGVVNEFYAVVFKESVNLCYSFIHVRD
jgi:hypothetical protein